MISSGIFILPGIAFAKAGPGMVVSYLIAGVLVLPALFCKAELTSAMPRAGGSFFHVDRSLGTAAGTLAGIASWLALSLKSAFALFGVGAVLILVKPDISEMQIKIVASVVCIIFMAINLLSTRHSGGITRFPVLFINGVLVLYVGRGVTAIQEARFHPFFPHGLESVFYTAGLVVVSYGGLTKITNTAEEVKNPRKNIPLGMFLAFIITTVLYVLVSFITVGLVDKSVLANSLVPISDGARNFGQFWVIITAAAALLAFTFTGNGGILAASRIPMAMSRDDHLPSFFADIDPVHKVPYKSVFVTGGFMVASIMLMNLKLLVKTASIMQITIFILAIISVIVMRESNIGNYRPEFKSPLYPWIHIVAILGYGVTLTSMGKLPLIIAFIFFGIGIFWYIFYAHHQVNRIPALGHILHRITSKENFTPHSHQQLGRELGEIIRERDEIEEDRFDHLIRKCQFLEIAELIDYDEFFKISALFLGPSLKVEKEFLYEELVKIEEESTAVYQPGVAIPHLVIKNNDRFDMLVARSKKGVEFSEWVEPVHAIFVLIGSPPERKFYLHSLMALAQITADPNFMDDWLNARSGEDLRDVLLLAERKRLTSRKKEKEKEGG